MEAGGLYEFIDDRRANGIDEMDGELQKEDDEQERRHSSLWLALQEQTVLALKMSLVDNETVQP